MRLFLALALLFPLAALAQPADSISIRQGKNGGISIGFTPRFGAFYSSDKGFGIGGRVNVKNLVQPGSQLYLDVRFQERYTELGAMAFSGDPYSAPLFVGVGGEYASDRVRRYFGIGPRTLRQNRVHAHVESTGAELRVGWHPLEEPTLLVQPVVRLLHWNVHSFYDDRDAAFINLDPASQRNLFDTVSRPTTGVTYGLELAYTRLDRARYPSRGWAVEAAGRRYDGLGDNAFQYWSNTTMLYGFVPTTGRQVLFGRLVFAQTHPVGDTPIPFYALPHLDNRLLGSYTRFRFAGNDMLALSLGYRFPIFTFYDWYGVDANIQVSAANAYDDFFDQFKPGLSFDKDLRSEGERTPLRPALSLGLDLVNVDEGRIVIGGQLGIDPEGYRVGTMRFVYSIRDTHPLVR